MRKILTLLFISLTIFSCSVSNNCILGKDYTPENKPYIVVFGDTRTNDDAHRKVVEAIKKTSPTAVFHTGDLVADGRIASQWSTFDSIEGQMINSTHYYPTPGNHEHDSPLYWSHFKLPSQNKWYAVDELGVHFIVLNSEVDLTPGSPQYNWLLDDLQKSEKKYKFKLALFHSPPFSTGRHKNDELGFQKTIVPLFEKYGIDMVFNGHQHCYEHLESKGIYYIVAGGGGAPLYKQERKMAESKLYLQTYHFCALTVDKNSLTMVALTPDLKEFDRIVITK